MNNANKSHRLNRLTALLVATGCIAGPMPAGSQTVIIGDTTTVLVTVPPILGPVDTLILGNTASGNGTLNFNGGTLDINHAGGYSGYVTVGNSGVGTINQGNSAGSSIININGPQYVSPANQGDSPAPWGGYLFLGRNNGSTGSYVMTDTSGGATPLQLNVQREIQIGGSNISTQAGGGFTCLTACTGSFVQNGGNVTATGVSIGIGAGSGSYTLNSGTLNAVLDVGNSSSGANTFTHNDGTVNAGLMFVGNGGGSNGTYVLNNGTLNSGAFALVGGFGTGTVTQESGVHNAGVLQLGSEALGTGTYDLNNGTVTIGTGLTDQLVVGHNGVGTFNMARGLLEIQNGDVNTGAFIVGNNVGSDGTFTQTGGLVLGGRSLTIGANGGTGTYNLNNGNDPTLNVSILTIGFAGTGTFNQQDGTTVVTNNIFMGSDRGTYNMSGGLLNVSGGQGTIVGTFNVADFNQSGGTHNTNELIVGNQSFSQATYNMSGGTLNVFGDMLVGRGQADVVPGVAGLFRQTAGDVVTNTLWIGGDTRVPGEQHYGRGHYELVDGTVTSQTTLVGNISPGSVLQTGGTFNAGQLIIGRSGSFTAAGSVTETSTFDLQGGQLNTTGTLISQFGMGTFNHSGSAEHIVTGNLVIGSETAIVFPFPELGPLTQGIYNLSGSGVLNVSDTTTLGAALDAKGTFNQSGGTATMTSLNVGSGGTGIVNLSAGQMDVSGNMVLGNGAGTGTVQISGGALNVGNTLFVGRGDNDLRPGLAGLIHQDGGVVSANVIQIAGGFDGVSTSKGRGRYELVRGTVTANATDVGNSSQGSVLQTGGTFNAGSLVLGSSGLFAADIGNGIEFYSQGTYDLHGGQLNTTGTTVSVFGKGIFNQTAGGHSVTGNLLIGSAPGLPVPNSSGAFRDGVYNFSGGTLTVSGLTTVGAGNNDWVGEPGAIGKVNHSSGSAILTGDLIVGGFGTQSGGTGSYNLTGPGALNVGGALIVAQGGATGTFNQSNGAVTVSGFLTIGEDVGANGTYKLSGGTLTVSGSDSNTMLGGGFAGNPGSGGVGTFEQTGGTFQTSFLNIGGGGFAQKGTGTYTLNTGSLIVDNNLVMGNNSGGSATFNQTGGTVQVNSGAFGAFIDNGTYTLTGNGTLSVVSNLIMGGVGGVSSNFSQSGTTQVTLGHDLSVAQVAGSTASYSLTSSGATLTTGRAYVGESGTGTFTQTAGTVSITAPGGSGDLIIGSTASGNGTYNMSGGTLSVSANNYIGDAGTGSMNLTGNSVVTVTGNTYIGNNGTGANTGALTIANNSSYTSNGAVPGGITLGQNTGSSGSIVISDAGALSTFNRLTVGAAGTGSLLQSGTSVVTAGGVRVADGVTGGASTYTMNGGTLNVLNTSGVEGGTRIGLAGIGTFTQNAGTHNTTYVEVGGTNFAQGGGGTGVYNLNGGALVSSGAISTNPQGGSSGTLNVAGGTLTAPVIINKDTVNYSGGSIAANINNSANVNVSGGAARTLTGNLSNNTGGVLTVAAATPFTVSGVLTNAAGASILAGSNITVGQDYNNLASGSGNAYNRRANVGGAGQIIGNLASQTIAGNVTAAGADTWILDLGNVRGGSGPVTKNYQIVNSGSGADIRGAIQTNGLGNITDGRLGGAGVSAGNFGPIAAAANSGNLAVTFSGAAGAALSGQKVAIVSNFDNVSTQIVNITGGAVSALAVGNATPTGSPAAVNLGNFRVGTAGANTSFSVQNQTSGAGAEQLGINNVSASSGFNATNAFGSGLIGPGAAQAGAVTARASGGGAAGVNTGTVTINYATDGTNIDASFARTAANSQFINVQATGWNLANGNATPAGSVNLGNFHVGTPGGAAPQSASIDVSNQAAAAFSEQLKVSSASVNNAAFTLANNIGNGLVNGGATFNNALNVGRAGGVAGINTGTVSIQYQSDGSNTSGFGAININNQDITVNATGYRLASANTIGAVSFGNVHVGDTVNQALSITNTAVADGFSEKLSASFGSTTDARITTSGTISLLGAGQNNASSMVVGLNTTAVGNVNGTARVLLTSDGSGTSGLGLTALAPQDVGVSGDITLSGSVFRLASASPVTPNPVNFGNVRLGAATNQVLTISNTAANDGFSEKLNASIGGATAGVTSNNGSFSLLAAQGANNTNLSVGLDTLTAGAKSGTAAITLVSDGTGTSGLGQTALASQTVTITGNVFRLATGDASPAPLDLGNFRLSAPTVTGSLTIKNTAANDGSSEQLGIQSVSSTNALFTASSGLGATRVNAQGSAAAAVTVGLGAGLTAGVNSGGVSIQYLSDGTAFGTGGAINSNLQIVGVTATGYNSAVGSTAPTPITMNRRVGEAATQVLTVSNTAAAGAFSEALNAAFVGSTGSASNNGGNINNLIAGGSNAAAMSVSLNTGTAGAKSGIVTIAYQTDGAGPNGNSGLSAISAGTQAINVSGNVYTAAVGQVAPAAVNFGTVRVGDVVGPRNLTVNNTAAVSALNDTLSANLNGVSGPFNGATSVSGIAAQSSGTISVGLNTSAAGIFSQNGNVSFMSHNDEMADASAGVNQPVTVTAKVNSYANAIFSLLTGSGALSVSGTDWILDLGNVALNSSSSRSLKLVNSVSGPADTLSGLFALTDNDDFQLNGWGPVAGLDAGQASGSLDVSFLFLHAGTFTDTIDFDGRGTNETDLVGVAQHRRLVIRANVTDGTNNVPEPGTLALILLAAAGAILARRQRKTVH